MNTPRLETERLVLRRFTEEDLDAIYRIFSDVEVNTFLPWFPLKSAEDAKAFYGTRFAARYALGSAYSYAVCLKGGEPIGYVNVGAEDAFDFGYGLRREFWGRGIITEAGRAVIERLKKGGIPYITATHDVKNPRSGGVMRRLGMKYRYSYDERWQPKDLTVTFRMYQLNLDGNKDRVYRGYWDASDVHFVEKDV